MGGGTGLRKVPGGPVRLARNCEGEGVTTGGSTGVDGPAPWPARVDGPAPWPTERSTR